MEKRLRPSDFNFEDVTWDSVLQKAEIDKNGETAKYVTSDDGNVILHLLLEGNKLARDVFRVKLPESDFKKIMSVVLQLQESASTKRARIEKCLPAPSDYGKNCQKDKNTVVFDHRNTGAPTLHISLQVELFGHFIDEVLSDKDPDEKYYLSATNVMQQMSEYFSTELDRRNAFFREMKFCRETVSICKNHGKSDSTISVRVNGQEYPIVNFEFKKEFGSSQSCPNIAYYMNFKEGEDRKTPRSPMLLVSLIGTHYLQVFGAVWNGATICVDPLTTPLSLLFVPRDPLCPVREVAKVLSAIDSAVPRLEEYYNHPDSFGVKGPYYRCTSIEYVDTINGNPWLYSAKTTKENICMKFVRKSYGEEVHQLLAENNLAPKLIECCPIPGGWTVVLMEKVQNGEMLKAPANDTVKMSLRKVLDLMEGKKYVHGDLRPQNIIVACDMVYVVDFDWAGEENVARYPPELQKQDRNWAEGVEAGGLIKKGHDKHLIQPFL